MMMQTLCKALALVLAVSRGVLGAYPTGDGPAVAIKSITQLGNMTYGDNTRFSRDGGVVGSVGGVNMWFWCDTNLYNAATGAWEGFYDSTTSVSSISHPTLMTTPVKYGIPWTAYENAFYAEHFLSPRIIHWPTSPPVEVSPGKGLMWVKRDYYGSNPKNAILDNIGTILCNVTVKADGTPVVQRVSGDVPMFPNSGIMYGNMAATKDDKYVYLYGTAQSATFIARAPLAHADKIGQFQYFHNDTQKWTSKAPQPNDTSSAILSHESMSWGSVYYSTYHKMWINIFSYSLSMQVYYRTALQPQGPWVNRTLVYTAPPTGKIGYIYGTQGTNLYDPSGKTALVDFTWFWGDYANWVIQINWA